MMRPFKNWFKYLDINKSFFEWNGPQLFDEPTAAASSPSATQRWRGPFLRIGNMRFKVEKFTTRHKVERYPDRVVYQFHFYYDRGNTYAGDRTMRYGRSRVVY